MKNSYFFLWGLLLISCHQSGKFKYRTFDLPKVSVMSAIDSLYKKHPVYRPPSKWTIYNSFTINGREFATERRFYFPAPSEEMIYVSILPFDSETKLIIIAVHTNDGWRLEEDLSSEEITRIEEKFDRRIISKLEILTGTKSVKQ